MHMSSSRLYGETYGELGGSMGRRDIHVRSDGIERKRIVQESTARRRTPE